MQSAGVVDDLKMHVNLYISARKLKNMDTFSKSDPRCVMYEKKNNQWIKVA